MHGGGEELRAGGFGLGEFGFSRSVTIDMILFCSDSGVTRRREEDKIQGCSLRGFAPSRAFSSFQSAAPFETRDNPFLINSAPKLMR